MKIEQNVPLNDKNWFQTGGPAEFYAAPTTAQEFQEALTFAREKKLSITILGQGANVLIADQGIKGLVIHPHLTHISAKENVITAGSGLKIQECIDWCLDNNYLGLEEFSGIPGSIGGATCMNIHYFKSFLSDFLVGGEVINQNTNEIKSVDKEWFGFGYDESKLQEHEWILLTATFKLTPCTEIQAAYAKGRRDEIIRHRNSRYPNSHTCGSFFRNFHEHELKDVKNGQKLPFIAYYLDSLGIKGSLTVGGAQVSHQHANMLVNKNNGTTNDLIMLAKKMQDLVFERFNIRPVAECQFLGFDKNPLE